MKRFKEIDQKMKSDLIWQETLFIIIVHAMYICRVGQNSLTNSYL